MPGCRSAARGALPSFLILASALAAAQERRLSRSLLEAPAPYAPGVSWRVPGEEAAQQLLRHELLSDLAAQPSLRGLHDWIGTLPVTGRVPVASADPRWLLAHPRRDPLLEAGHTVVLPPRPRSVTVLGAQGERCAVTHASGREAMAYVEACSLSGARALDWVWLAQPDGRVERYGVAPWNREAQDEPAPGAWIWAPPREARISDALSERLMRFLATQGPAADPPT